MEWVQGKSQSLRVFFKTTRFLAIASAFFVMFLMLYITADVFGRYVFNKPMPNSLAVSETLMVIIAFLGLAYVQARKMNIRLDILTNRFNPSTQTILEIFSMLLSFLIVMIMVWGAWGWAWQSWIIKDDMQGTFPIPYYISKFALVIGLFFLVVQFIIDFVQLIQKFVNRASLLENQKGK